MWETRSVTLTVRLPRDIAAQAEEVHQSDPEFLSRVVLYGLTRRSIYRHLREENDDIRCTCPAGTSVSTCPHGDAEHRKAKGVDDLELTEHERRILAENPSA